MLYLFLFLFRAFPFRSGLLATLKPFVKNMKASLKTLVSSKLEPEFYSLPYIFFYHKCFDPSGNIPNAPGLDFYCDSSFSFSCGFMDNRKRTAKFFYA